MLVLTIYRVLSRNQIHWDKWPTGFEKSGPFPKIWGPSELSIYRQWFISIFMSWEDKGTVRLLKKCAFQYLVMKIKDSVFELGNYSF